MDASAIPEIERPRSAVRLVGMTLSFYRLRPGLFLLLAAVVVVPEAAARAAVYELPLNVTRGLLELALAIASFALFLPLVAALHVFAIDDLRRGEEPSFGSVTRRGIATLRRVSAATVLSWLGIFVGFLLLIVPGIYLTLRWSVVAQSAALEEGGWRNALDRSRRLAEDHHLHILALLLLVALAIAVPGVLLWLLLGLRFSLAASLIRLPFNVATTSFGALAAALLYFDLFARQGAAAAKAPPTTPVIGAAPTGHPLDPDSYSDEDRPPGWYVVPEKPWRMRYWLGADTDPGWSRGTSKTPKQTLAGWYKVKS